MRELEPLDVNFGSVENFGLDLARSLVNNPNGIQPVYLWSHTGVKLGKFFATFPKEGEKFYIQLEGFDPSELAEDILKNLTVDWKVHPGGIYRLEL